MRHLSLCLAALLAWPFIANAQLPPAPAGAPTVAPAAPSTFGAQPDTEDRFVKAIEDGRQTFNSGINDMVRGVARPRRADALCRAVPRGRVENWVGKMAYLGSSAAGRGVVAVEISPKIMIATNRTDAADERDKTLIDTRGPLYAYAAALAVGDRVQFSGTLIAASDDCFKEASKDLKLAMTEPEFVIRLDSIKKVIPPSSNAVLSGQAPAMSIAQSSDYVRDAVDIVASAAACGAENRRVFAIIIKVLIRASAGQTADQRDALIDLMFAPPSPQTQNRENCEGKLAALGRLEAEAS